MNTPNKKVGRPRAYTPEAKFEEYVEWVKANPRYSNKASAGEIIPVPASPDIGGILPICEDQQAKFL